MIGSVFKQELESTFQVVRHRSSQKELVVLCPMPGCGDQSGNFSINLTSGKSHCWRCNASGHITNLARRIGIKFLSAGNLNGVSLEDINSWEKPSESVLPLVRPVKLPRGFIRLTDEPDSVYVKYITRMAKRKHLSYDDFAKAGVGFTRDSALWEPFAIFPVFEDGVPVYYQGRRYSEEPGEKTKRFPGRSEVKYGARYWIYNIDELRKKRAPTVLVVEAILNVLSLKRKLAALEVDNVVPVAVFKHGISTEQMLKLNQCTFLKEMCLLFDHDAIDQSWKGANKITNRIRTTIAEMPAGDNNSKLDPNDDVDLAWNVFKKRVPYTMANANIHHADSRLRKLKEHSLAGRRL